MGLPIGAVERETGISKDLLRMWERRYGFPEPARDEQGDRLYSRQQVEKLRLVRRLMDMGFRPGKIINLPMAELLQQVQAHQPRLEAPAPCHELIRVLLGHNPAQVQTFLQTRLHELGLQVFVREFIATCNQLVGEAWMRGELQVYEEHFYSEQINRLLRETLSRMSLPMNPPRVLLTTCPGEMHMLGLLMVEVVLRMANAETLPFGCEMPCSDIASAARKHQVDVVLLSFSSAYEGDVAEQVQTLQSLLPPHTEIWVGGGGCRGLRSHGQLSVLANFNELDQCLNQWRQQRQSH